MEDQTIIVDGGVLVWRVGMGRTAEIHDICVTSERRKGRGRNLIAKLKRAVPSDTALIYAITRISNTIAHQFYESMGFRIVGRLHYFYRDLKAGGYDNSESALVYGLDL